MQTPALTYLKAALPLEVNSPDVDMVVDLYVPVDDPPDGVLVVKLVSALLLQLLYGHVYAFQPIHVIVFRVIRWRVTR